VLDLQMPDISGTEVLRALNLAGAHFPVIIITAHDAPSMRTECLRLGAAAYLCKPLDIRALIEAVTLAVEPTR
jgi:DNA-binding response OmpR family regulator